MPPPNKLTAAKRAEVEQLARDGIPRNEISRRTGVSAGSVTNICQAAGVTFDRAAVAQAIEARKVDCAARRAALEAAYLDDADRLRQQLWLPHTYIDHGGKDFTRVEWTQPEPSPSDKYKLMLSSKAALDSSLKITAVEAQTEGGSAVDKWLEHMLGGSE